MYEYIKTNGSAKRVLARDRKIERWIERLLPVQEAVTCVKVPLPLQRGWQTYSEAIIFVRRLLVHKVYQLSLSCQQKLQGIN